MSGGDPLEWYNDIPIVSRLYLTFSFVTTAACALDLVSPFSLYFNYKLIVGVSSEVVYEFLFLGMFSVDFLFHMYFLVRYSRLLEDGYFRGRTADFLFMLLVGAYDHDGTFSPYCCESIHIHTHTHTHTHTQIVAPFVNIQFLGSSLTFMMVYIWGQRNPMVRMSFLGLFPLHSTVPSLGSLLLLRDAR